MNATKRTSLRTWIKPLLLSLCCAFLLLIYAPFELYLTNQEDFWFTSGMLLPMALLMFAGCTVLATLALLLGRRINEKLYRVLFAAGAVLFICSYVQGNFLVSSLPLMNGKPVDWNAYPIERLQTVLLWLIVAALAALLIRKLGFANFEKGACLLAGAVSLILTITLVTLSLSSQAPDKSTALTTTDKELHRMSGDRNFIILILDAVDGSEFKRILAEGDNQDVFQDFTYYENTVGSYPYSRCALPLIESGKWYESDVPFSEYLPAALLSSPLLNRAESEEYSIGLYTTMNDPYLQKESFEGRYVNMLEDAPAIGSQSFACKLLLKMGIIKYAPWDLKFLGYDLYGRLTENRVYKGEDGVNYFSDSDRAFYLHMQQQEPFELAAEKCFKLIHLEGSHEPYDLDADVNPVADGSYQDKIRASIKTAGQYFTALKDSGLYDNSVIVVMSDHGYAVGYEGSNMQQNPILLIKGVDERHDMQTSSAPISYDDLQDAFLLLMDGSSGDKVFPWQEGDERERRFMFYDAVHMDFTEYVQTGHAADMSTMLPTGRTFTASR